MSELSKSDDDDLERALTAALRGMRPHESTPPATLKQGALWVHEFHNMEAELASVAETDAASLGARSSDRSLLFSFGERHLEIRVERRGTSTQLTGAIAPAAEGTVEGVLGGRFVSDSVSPTGSFSLSADTTDGSALLVLRLSGGDVRLEPFTF